MVLQFQEPDSMTNGIVRWKIAVHECAIDHGKRSAIVIFCLVPQTAFLQPNMKHSKVAGIRHVQGDYRRLFQRKRPNLNGHGPSTVCRSGAVRDTSHGDTGKLPES